jgi:hypothetical protein
MAIGKYDGNGGTPPDVSHRERAMSGLVEQKAKEYVFLLYAALAATAYAVVHDQLTATLSPEYFLVGKGLAGDPHPLRWAVTLLAARAGFGPGLLVGVALLVSNNPRRAGAPPQLPFRALVKLSLVPLVLAATTACLAGVVNAFVRIGSETAVALLVPPERAPAFAIVWAIHAGSYAGALLGTGVSALLVMARRRATRSAGAR